MNKKTNRPIEKKIYVILPVMIWIIGLVLAGSEGVLMPYLNVAGAVVFFGASVWLGRILPRLEPDAKVEKNSRKKVRYSIPSQTKVDYCFADMIMAAPKAPIIWGCSGTRTSFSKASDTICTIQEFCATPPENTTVSWAPTRFSMPTARLTTLK